MCLITHNFGRGSFGYVGLQSGSLLAEYKRLKTTNLARALSVALLSSGVTKGGQLPPL